MALCRMLSFELGRQKALVSFLQARVYVPSTTFSSFLYFPLSPCKMAQQEAAPLRSCYLLQEARMTGDIS